MRRESRRARRGWRELTMAAAGALLLAGCGDAPPEGVSGAPEEVEYSSSLGVDLNEMQRLETGVYTEDLQMGQGKPAEAGDLVVVNYTGWLPDGTEFDSSRGRGPFSFTLGAGEVIPGWEQGVMGMQPGGQRRLVIPPELAYGEEGAGGVIPPSTTLVFDVELVELR